MGLFQILSKETQGLDIKFIIIMAMIAGLTNALLLAVINHASEMVSNNDVNLYFLVIYAVIFALFYVSKHSSLMRSAEYTEHIIKNIRIRVTNKIRKAELETLEKADSSKIYTALTQDTNTLSQAAMLIVNAAQSGIMVLFSLIYIFIISPPAFFVIIIMVAIAVISYLSLSGALTLEFEKSLENEGHFFSSLSSILYGFKELKINLKKSNEVFDNHFNILSTLEEVKVSISKKFVYAMMFSQVFLYLLLAVIIFVIPHIWDSSSDTIIKVTASLLFIIGPIESLVDILPTYGRADAAARDIQRLEENLDYTNKNMVNDNEEYVENFDKIILRDVEFDYLDNNNQKIFGIGSIDLEINKGETIFIIGGNGSGKSTFVKLLLGLYFPTKGSIFVDDDVVDEYNYQSYRELFSTILSDFYLFDKIYGVDNIDQKNVDNLLTQMQLRTKTKFSDNAFTNKELSTGQRKRLALINTILEDKQIYIFDEWAADQDPQFRKYFYEDILSKFKEQGKTIIAVTHDDQYFNVADKIYKMEYGKLNEYKKN